MHLVLVRRIQLPHSEAQQALDEGPGGRVPSLRAVHGAWALTSILEAEAATCGVEVESSVRVGSELVLHH